MSVFSGTDILHIPRLSRLSAQVRSRLRPPDIDLEIVREVLAQYGLKMADSPRNLPNARRNRNLIVRTSAGKRVLKLYRPDWHTSTIDYEHSILIRLAQLGFPAPRLATTSNRRTWLSIGGDHYALFGFLEGETYSTSFLLRPHRMRLMTTAGQTLARLHKRLKGFLPAGQHHLGFTSYVGGRHRDMGWHIDKVGELKERSRLLPAPEDRAHTDWLIAHRDEILDGLSRLDESLSGASLPRVIIHGDYGLHNLIFQGPYRATPIDFELARLEWRLSDLVSVVSKFRYGAGSYDLDSILQFMHGYQGEYPIGDDEWQHFPSVWRHHKLTKAVQYWSSYFETGGPTRKLLSARDEVGQASWALDNPHKLSELRPARRGCHDDLM